jgi:hypothetical protein
VTVIKPPILRKSEKTELLHQITGRDLLCNAPSEIRLRSWVTIPGVVSERDQPCQVDKLVAAPADDSSGYRRVPLRLTAQRQQRWMIPSAYDRFEADAVTFATRCLVTGCSLCVLISAIPQRTFSSGM